jgi:hypothetical protein
MKTWQRVLLIIGIVVIVLILAVLIILPGYIRSYIEEHDQELVGREITIGDIDINYFTASLEVTDFAMKETDGETNFVSFERMFTDANLWSIFRKHLVITKYHLDGARIRVVQDGLHFNFDDLLELAGASDTNTVEEEDNSEPWHVTVKDVDLRRNSLSYESNLHPELSFDSIRLTVPIASDTSRFIISDVSLDISTGGSMRLHNVVDLQNAYYTSDLMAQDLEIRILAPYVEPFMDIGGLEGKYSSNFYVGGSWENTDIFNMGGFMAIDNFALLDQRKQAVVALEHGEIDLDTIRLNEGYYRVNRILADGFSGLFERYADGDNFSNMLVDYEALASDSAAQDSIILITDEESEIDYSNPFSLLSFYLKDIVKSYDESSYKLGEIDVRNSSFNFNDFATSDPFRYELTDMRLHADSLSSSNESMTFNFSSTLNNTGRFEGYVRLYTDNLEDLDLHYNVLGTDLTAFSPYTRDYVDYPIAIGDVQYISDTKIRDGQLVSSNVIDCHDFTWGERSASESFYNLPVKLAVSLLKDVNGDIHLDVPVEGDLHDPSFKLGKVIWNTIKNIIVKIVSAPFKLLGNMFGVDAEELKQINFNLLQSNLHKTQEKQLKDLSKILRQKEDLNIEFKRITKKYEELERYAVSASKYEYLKGEQPPDALAVSREVYEELINFNTLDSGFAQFVDQRIPEADRDLPIQKKCMIFIGEEQALRETDKVGSKRVQSIRAFLVEEGGIDSTRIRFVNLPEDSLIAHRSNSIFNIGFWVEE